MNKKTSIDAVTHAYDLASEDIQNTAPLFQRQRRTANIMTYACIISASVTLVSVTSAIFGENDTTLDATQSTIAPTTPVTGQVLSSVSNNEATSRTLDQIITECDISSNFGDATHHREMATCIESEFGSTVSGPRTTVQLNVSLK